MQMGSSPCKVSEPQGAGFCSGTGPKEHWKYCKVSPRHGGGTKLLIGGLWLTALEIINCRLMFIVMNLVLEAELSDFH